MKGSEWQGFQFQNLVISWKESIYHCTFVDKNSGGFLFQEKGFGQCGLPPKKKLCYLADIHDCKTFAYDLQRVIRENQGKVSEEQIDQFQSKLFKAIPQEYFRYFHRKNVGELKFQNLARQIIGLLYWAYKIKQPQYKAAITALEFASLDYFAKILKMSLTNFIFPQKIIENKVAYSFYTLSYQQDSVKMIENALQFLKFTSYIKIKYVDNIPSLLSMLIKLQQFSQDRVKGYMIDANASWKPKSFREMNICLSSPIYSKIRNKMMFIQQPFPVQMTQEQYEQWKILKKESIIKIMIDQSFTSFDQASPVLSLGHGINIKSQKAGGPINCVRSALLARQYGLQLMLGSMVSTHHGCTQTYCLYPLTQWLDVDGSLLVQNPDLRGGFGWNGSLPLKQPENKYFGVEIDTSEIQ